MSEDIKVSFLVTRYWRVPTPADFVEFHLPQTMYDDSLTDSDIEQPEDDFEPPILNANS